VISCELTRLSLTGITYEVAVEEKVNIMKAAASRRSPEESDMPKPAPSSVMGRSMDKENAEVSDFFFERCARSLFERMQLRVNRPIVFFARV
jgi:hypothetical protein